MHGPDPGAGQHGINGLGDHRHVNRDAVALFYAAFFQKICKAANFVLEFAIGNSFVLARRIAFPDEGGTFCLGFDVAVDAVVTGVQYAVFVPADGNVVLEAGVFDNGRLDEPVEAFGHPAPELLRVVDRFFVHYIVLILGDGDVTEDVL